MTLVQDMQSFWRGSAVQKAVLLLCLGVMAFSVFRFVTKGIIPSIDELGYDYYHQYAAGQLWNENANAYDYSLFRARLYQVGQERATTFDMGYLYPPHVIFLASGLSHLSFDTAYGIQLVVSVVGIIAGIVLLGVALSWFRPVGLLEITFLIALLNTVSSRDGLRASTLSTVIFTLLMIVFVAAHYRRDGTAGFALFLAASKPTFVPLYVLYI